MVWFLPAMLFTLLVCVLLLLVQVQRCLQRTQRKLNALLRHFNIDLVQGLPLSDRVKELARDPRRKIEAIKVYREETGVGLAEAKEAVEAFTDTL